MAISDEDVLLSWGATALVSLTKGCPEGKNRAVALVAQMWLHQQGCEVCRLAWNDIDARFKLVYKEMAAPERFNQIMDGPLPDDPEKT